MRRLDPALFVSGGDEQGGDRVEQRLARRPSLVEERSHPNHWFNRASDLHAAAGAVWVGMENDEETARQLNLPEGFSMALACRPVYFMLCGLALEVVMKAVLVQRGASEGDYGSHRFDDLTRLLKVRISEPERKLLRFYEASLVWAGRYPTPKRATEQALRDFWSLATDVLTEPVPEVKGIALRRGSDVGDWRQYAPLWQKYAALFEHR